MNKHWGRRAVLYAAGVFCLAFGAALSVNTNLGVSPVNSLPYVLSLVSGVGMGTCVMAVFGCYVLMQALLLRREFAPINLLQLPVAVLFGRCVDLSKLLLGGLHPESYAVRLALLGVSIFLIALGLLLYLEADIVTMPMEGMVKAVTAKLGRLPFHTVKIIMDVVVVVLAAGVSLAGLGGIQGLREGTLLTALLVGKLLDLLARGLRPRLRRIRLGAAEAAREAEAAAR